MSWLDFTLFVSRRDLPIERAYQPARWQPTHRSIYGGRHPVASGCVANRAE
jgi:hypothetical protein